MGTLKLVNEDGTSLDDCPKNPLLEKWLKLYPQKDFCKKLDEENIVNYYCIMCNKCPYGDEFEIPKEDLKEFNEHLKRLREYINKHNPSVEKLLKYEKIEDSN